MPRPIRHRISARTTPEILAVLKRAAKIEGSSLTDLVAATARVTIEQTETIRLSGEDAQLFAQLLLDLPLVGAATPQT